MLIGKNKKRTNLPRARFFVRCRRRSPSLPSFVVPSPCRLPLLTVSHGAGAGIVVVYNLKTEEIQLVNQQETNKTKNSPKGPNDGNRVLAVSMAHALIQMVQVQQI
jgi:hypothetical protein